MDTKVLAVEIAKLELKPDDRLLITVPLDTSAEAIARLDKALRAVFGSPIATRCLVVTGDVKFSVVPALDREDETHA